MYFTVSTSTQAIYISFTISDAIAGKFRNVDESRAWCRSILGAGKNLDKDTQRLEYRNFTSVGLAFDSPAYVLWPSFLSPLPLPPPATKQACRTPGLLQLILIVTRDLYSTIFTSILTKTSKFNHGPGFAFLQVQPTFPPNLAPREKRFHLGTVLEGAVLRASCPSHRAGDDRQRVALKHAPWSLEAKPASDGPAKVVIPSRSLAVTFKVHWKGYENVHKDTDNFFVTVWRSVKHPP
jgi:hypothetical protein